MTQKQATQLGLPDLREEAITKVRSYSHSFRKGGPRVQHQVINNKHIFHNYGLGAAAVPVSYGASMLSAKSYTIFFDPTVADGQCAVIGAGVLGLMTAIEHVKRGRRVTVYAESFPELNPKEGDMQILSQMSPVVWLPNEYDWSEDMLMHQIISKLSFDFYRESLSISRYQSLKEVAVYDGANQPEDLKEIVGNFVTENMFSASTIQYEGGTQQPVTLYKTILIDSMLFLEELRIEAILRGVKFVQRKFNNLQEILNLSESAIWNCTNSSSSYLFEDQSFKQDHYIMIEFEELTHHKHQFVLKSSRKGQQNFELQCIGKKTILVVKTKQKVKQKNNLKLVIEGVKQSLNSRKLKPKL